MNETPDLFGSCIRQALSEPPLIQRGTSIVPRARRDNVHTSVQAALSALGLADGHRTAVLADLMLHKTATGHEIAARIGLTYQQVSKRLPELHETGRVARVAIGHTEDGKVKYWTRPSPSGRACCVWQAVQQNASG